MSRVLKEKKPDRVEIGVMPTLDGKLLIGHDADFMKVADDPRVIGETLYADLEQLDIGSWFGPAFSRQTPHLLDAFLALAKDGLPSPYRLQVSFPDGASSLKPQRATARAAKNAATQPNNSRHSSM